MANQTNQEGFTSMDNRLLEAFIFYFSSGLKKDIILLLIKTSTEFQKNSVKISVKEMAEKISRPKSKVSIALGELIRDNVIRVVSNFEASHKPRVLSLNMDFETWKSPDRLPKGKQFTKRETVDQKGGRTVAQMVTVTGDQKVNSIINKPPVNKGRNRNPKKEYSPESKEFLLSSFLLKLIRERRESFRMPEMQDWCRHMDLLINHDRQSPEEIERVIAWSQKERFWKLNIISTESLRNNYDKLAIQMEASKEEKKTAKKLVAESDRIRL